MSLCWFLSNTRMNWSRVSTFKTQKTDFIISMPNSHVIQVVCLKFNIVSINIHLGEGEQGKIFIDLTSLLPVVMPQILVSCVHRKLASLTYHRFMRYILSFESLIELWLLHVVYYLYMVRKIPILRTYSDFISILGSFFNFWWIWLQAKMTIFSVFSWISRRLA